MKLTLVFINAVMAWIGYFVVTLAIAGGLGVGNFELYYGAHPLAAPAAAHSCPIVRKEIRT